jgi:hypothetical protein
MKDAGPRCLLRRVFCQGESFDPSITVSLVDRVLLKSTGVL